MPDKPENNIATGNNGVDLETLRNLHRAAYESDVQLVSVSKTAQGTLTEFGSGTFITKDGWALTANHVVGSADKVMGRTNFSSDPIEFEVKARDPVNDLAVLKAITTPAGIKPLPVGDSLRLRADDVVVAEGHPHLGYNREQQPVMAYPSQASAGRYGLHQFIGSYESYRAHTSVETRPGNSGGAVVGPDGSLVGIVSDGEKISGNKGYNGPYTYFTGADKAAELLVKADSDKFGLSHGIAYNALENAAKVGAGTTLSIGASYFGRNTRPLLTSAAVATVGLGLGASDFASYSTARNEREANKYTCAMISDAGILGGGIGMMALSKAYRPAAMTLAAVSAIARLSTELWPVTTSLEIKK